MKPALLATLKSNNYLLNCMLAMAAQESNATCLANASAWAQTDCSPIARLPVSWALMTHDGLAQQVHQERGGRFGIHIRNIAGNCMPVGWDRQAKLALRCCTAPASWFA